MSHDTTSRRLDQWLWFARFCKSRSVATTYYTKRGVRINSRAVKRASQPVRIGDVLTLPFRGDIAVVRVVDLGVRRGPAREAAALYETIDPIASHGA
jgi:ribosome-associated heat shock protein Hsp15